MSAPRTIWRATDPEAAARRVAGRPAHAFWPLLAPSFRWVLLPPHRRAGGDAIEWEWRASPSPAKPGPADLNDLRARLRDSLDLLAQDLRRRPTLPDGLAAAALLDEFEQIFGALRHSPDQVLAAHAVLTDLGWMLRSWAFARPAPARADAPAPSIADHPPSSPPPASSANAGAPARRTRRWLVWALPALVLAAAAWWRHQAKETPPYADSPAQPEPARTAEPPKPNGDEKSLAEASSTEVPPATAGETPPAGGMIGSTEARAPVAAGLQSPPAPLAAAASTPAALTGEMASAPEARAPQAGPLSKARGFAETPPGFAARRADASAGGPPSASRADPPAGRAPDGGADPLAGNEGPAPAAAADLAEQQEKIEHGRTPEAATRPPPDPGLFSVEARPAPPPQSPAPALPGRAADARSPRPRTDAPEENTTADRMPSDDARAVERIDSKTGPSAGDGLASARGDPAADAARSWDAPARRLRLRAAPWRLVLERDIVLPTRPFEGSGEAEIRAARIAAWAQARARTPPAFRRKEILAGWTFTLDPGASGRGPLAWRAKVGTPAVREIDPAAGRARIGWTDSEAGEIDVWLADATGAPVARVWRRADENRLSVFVAPDVRELRPWFILRLRPADSGEGLEPPDGWVVERRKNQLLAEGPEDATRMRWTHADSGWVLHGGYTRESP